jgi:aspartyl-tRNA(Asn)/glutamyl-tRNA(Gln) amidotransferase subunit A
VGFKPTYGRISTAGLLGASPTFDHSGIIARTVEDAMRVYGAVAGYDVADPSTFALGTTQSALALSTPDSALALSTPHSAPSTSALRIGVARNFFFDRLDADVARAIEQAVGTFRDAKAEVRDITFPIDGDTMSRVFDPIIVAEIHQTFARDWKERPDAFSKSFAGFFLAPVPSGLELAAAQRRLREYQSAVRRVFDEVDVVLTPTVAVTAPLIDGVIDGALILRNTWPWNAARAPALSMPCGVDGRGLPIGMQLAAAPFAEDTLFRAAFTFAGRTEFHLRRPTL